MTARMTDTAESLAEAIREQARQARRHRNEFGAFCFLAGALIGAVITGALV